MVDNLRHTEAPWKAERAASFEGLDPLKCYAISGKGWGSFALVVADMDLPTDTAEGLLNVALIKHAPELLECLKDARRVLADKGDLIDLGHIDDVIAKAEGRS